MSNNHTKEIRAYLRGATITQDRACGAGCTYPVKHSGAGGKSQPHSFRLIRIGSRVDGRDPLTFVKGGHSWKAAPHALPEYK
jgi:hypothetical protein